MSRWSRVEIAMLFIAALALALSAYFVTRGLRSPSSATIEGKVRSIGKIQNYTRDVRRKRETELDYKSVVRDLPVFNRDSVFTGDESIAEVQLRSGSDLRISPNSIVVLRLEDSGETALSLQLGNFLAKLKPRNILKMGNMKTKAGTAETVAVMNKVGDSTQVTVLMGELEVTSKNGAPAVIRSNESMSVAGDGSLGKKVTYPVELASPAPGDLFVKKTRAKVELSWRKLPDARAYRVIVAKEPEFRRVIFDSKTEKNETTFESTEAGTFYWKVVARHEGSAGENESPASTFTVVENSPPHQVSPSPDQMFTWDRSEHSAGVAVDLAWNDQTLVEQFEIQIGKDPGFESHTVLEARATQTTTAPLAPGQYYWRVKAKHPKRPDAPWSSTARFSIAEKTNPVAAPVAESETVPVPVAAPMSETVPDSKAKTQRRAPAESVESSSKENTNSLLPKPETKPESVFDSESPSTSAEVSLPTPMQEPSIPSPSLSPAPSPEPTPTPALQDTSQNFWLWLGSGLNFTSYSQTIPGLSDAAFGAWKGPSYVARAGSKINEKWGVDLMYKETPGEVQSSPSLTVRNGEYRWSTISAESLYSLEPPLESASDSNSLHLRFGLQHHIAPFITPISLGEVEIVQNSFTMATAGFEYLIRPRKRLRWELMARYQYPISSSGPANTSLTLHPKFAFDGSLGQVYRLTESWSFGIYWYGQWHAYSFDYRDDATGLSFSGDQSLFYSNIDARIGFEF